LNEILEEFEEKIVVVDVIVEERRVFEVGEGLCVVVVVVVVAVVVVVVVVVVVDSLVLLFVGSFVVSLSLLFVVSLVVVTSSISLILVVVLLSTSTSLFIVNNININCTRQIDASAPHTIVEALIVVAAAEAILRRWRLQCKAI
jgi:hypothetical protein